MVMAYRPGARFKSSSTARQPAMPLPMTTSLSCALSWVMEASVSGADDVERRRKPCRPPFWTDGEKDEQCEKGQRCKADEAHLIGAGELLGGAQGRGE